jgi:hypothetical protein
MGTERLQNFLPLGIWIYRYVQNITVVFYIYIIRLYYSVTVL